MQINVQVPDNLNELTLAQYQKFQFLNTDDNANTPFFLQKVVEIFCNLDLKDVATIKYKSVETIVKHLNEVFSQKTNLVSTFELNGTEYGFIPVLDDMSLGEFIDLDNYLSDWDNMHKAMNVLYRPIKAKAKGKYIIEDYGEVDSSERFKQMPLDIVLGAIVFFYHLNNELLTITLSFLEAKIPTEMTSEQRLALERNGLGISQCMVSLKGILPSSIPLLN